MANPEEEPIKEARLIDPDPLSLGLGVIGATAAVIGVIELIRNALFQERKYKEDSNYRKREEARRDREIELLEEDATLRRELQELDAVLESMERQISDIRDVVYDPEDEYEHLDVGTKCVILPERDFYRYREFAIEISKTNTRLHEKVLAIEITLGSSASGNVPLIETSEFLDRLLCSLFMDATNSRNILLRRDSNSDESPRSHQSARVYHKNRLSPVLIYIRFARKHIDAILNSDLDADIIDDVIDIIL